VVYEIKDMQLGFKKRELNITKTGSEHDLIIHVEIPDEMRACETG
jgi:hypothetical protein